MADLESADKNRAGEIAARGRRHLLRGMAVGASLGIGAFLAATDTGNAAVTNGASAVFDGKHYGAKGDGVADDAPAVQRAIHAAATHGGGVVWLPPGVYLLRTGLVIPNQIVLIGAGWNSVGSPSNGTTLHVVDPEVAAVSIQGHGTIVRDLAILHRQPNSVPGWQPFPYPPAIRVQADDVHLEGLFLHNPTIGISVQDAQRTTLSRIWGQPLQVGIRIDNARDVVKVDNVHFFVFWSGEDPVMAYQYAQAHAIESYRNDNPQFSNIFALGYNAGFWFGESQDGVTSKFRIVNADTDISTSGIVIQGKKTTGQVVNYTFQGGGNPTHGIRIDAEDVVLQAANIRITNTLGSGVYIAGARTTAMLDGLWVQNWNMSRSGAPAVEAIAPDTVVRIGFGRLFTEGSGGPETGGTGRVLLAAE